MKAKAKSEGLKMGFGLDKKDTDKRVKSELYKDPAYILGKIDGVKTGREGVIREEREILDFLKKEFDKHYFDRRKVRDGLTNDTQLFIDYGYLNGLEVAIQMIEKKEWEG